MINHHVQLTHAMPMKLVNTSLSLVVAKMMLVACWMIHACWCNATSRPTHVITPISNPSVAPMTLTVMTPDHAPKIHAIQSPQHASTSRSPIVASQMPIVQQKKEQQPCVLPTIAIGYTTPSHPWWCARQTVNVLILIPARLIFVIPTAQANQGFGIVHIPLILGAVRSLGIAPMGFRVRWMNALAMNVYTPLHMIPKEMDVARTANAYLQGITQMNIAKFWNVKMEIAFPPQ
jgi:hypothetical protein